MKPFLLIAALALAAPQSGNLIPYTSSRLEASGSSFDVPPKDTLSNRCTYRGGIDCGFYPDDGEIVHHRTCEDKSRFLLMSEDGAWHCLKFEGASK